MVVLPKRPAGTPPDTVPSYLFRAAIQTRRTVNGAGIALRLVITLVMTASAAWVDPVQVLWTLPAWVGLALAGLEWTEHQLDGWSSTAPAPLARIAAWMVRNRLRFQASPAGIFEGVLGPVCMVAPFAGPFAVAMPPSLRVVNCVLVVLFVMSAAVQVVNDASLYNYRERPKMSRVIAIWRVLYPLFNALVALGIFLLTDRAFLTVEQSVAIAALLLLMYPLMGLSDAAHLGSTHAYTASLQDTLDFVRAAYASDIHRLKSSIRARAAFTAPETKAALLDVYLETELIRHLAVDGRTVASIGDGLVAVGVVLRERSKTTRIEFQLDDDVAALTIDPVGLQLLERLVLDTVDNSVKAGASTVTAAIRHHDEPHAAVVVEVDVSDDGPGYDVPETLPRGSSLRQLQRQCDKMSGRLAIESAPTGTRVRASFVTPLVNTTEGAL